MNDSKKVSITLMAIIATAVLGGAFLGVLIGTLIAPSKVWVMTAHNPFMWAVGIVSVANAILFALWLRIWVWTDLVRRAIDLGS